jgi:hypothetical protein
MYTKLTEDSSPDNEFLRYRRVYNWAKSVNLFEYTYLVFPIYKEFHFFLIAYYKPFLALNDKEAVFHAGTSENGCIFVFDSMKTKSKSKYASIISNLNDYLVSEWMVSYFSMLDYCSGLVSKKDLVNRLKQVKTHVVKCPQQPELDLSCGLYTIRNANLLLQECPIVSDSNVDNIANNGFDGFDYSHEDIVRDRQILIDTLTGLSSTFLVSNSLLSLNSNRNSTIYENPENIETNCCTDVKRMNLEDSKMRALKQNRMCFVCERLYPKNEVKKLDLANSQ